ncbi:MAG: hypothetical protein HYY01_00930 [Chloroflexi bacterium]|nr:hypothetical protein [Chloroflexota bacterium]
MEQDKPADGNAEGLIEDQLLKYARDLKQLFLEHKSLEDTAAQTKEQAHLRTQELVALNAFIRQRLLELFELEQEFRATLERLDAIASEVYPLSARETLKQCIAEGQQLFDRLSAHGV